MNEFDSFARHSEALRDASWRRSESHKSICQNELRHAGGVPQVVSPLASMTAPV
jgi:hypothetical protein